MCIRKIAAKENVVLRSWNAKNYCINSAFIEEATLTEHELQEPGNIKVSFSVVAVVHFALA